jgi:hypothetical protein
MDLLTESKDQLTETHVRKLLGLKEGELIPLPTKVLRVPGAPFDFYQLLKMTANSNLAHKVNYKPTGAGKGGANVTDIMMMFYDDVSYEEAKRLFTHFGIPFTDAPELSSEIGRTSGKPPFKSKTNPPDDAEQMFGRYLKPVTIKP